MKRGVATDTGTHIHPRPGGDHRFERARPDGRNIESHVLLRLGDLDDGEATRPAQLDTITPCIRSR